MYCLPATAATDTLVTQTNRSVPRLAGSAPPPPRSGYTLAATHLRPHTKRPTHRFRHTLGVIMCANIHVLPRGMEFFEFPKRKSAFRRPQRLF